MLRRPRRSPVTPMRPNHEAMSDPQVVPERTFPERARDGDADAWRVLYDAHAGRLVLWLTQTPTGDPGVGPDDLAMEAWTLAASRIADFHGTDDDFAAWLFTVARNHLLNIRRRSARRATYSSDQVPDAVAPSHASPVETTDAIRRALAKLPPRLGEVVALVDVVGVSTAEAALILGISRPAVHIARARGLAQLRRLGWQT